MSDSERAWCGAWCRQFGGVLAAVIAGGVTSAAIGDVVYFRGVDEVSAWEGAVGSWGTMDFTGFEFGHHVTDEYEESLGVVFTDSTNFVNGPSDNLFPRDGWGLAFGNFATFAEFVIDDPVYSLSMFYPGVGINVTLWEGDELVLQTNTGFPVGFFGLVSDVPFDRVRFDQGAGTASIDDIRIGMVVPGPATAGLLALGFVALGRRRRR